MIDATKARFETKHRARVNEILKDCESAIECGYSSGEYECSVDIYMGGTPEEVYTEVLDQLHNLGYKTHLTNYRETEKNVPCDQCSYYEHLHISWKETEK